MHALFFVVVVFFLLWKRVLVKICHAEQHPTICLLGLFYKIYFIFQLIFFIIIAKWKKPKRYNQVFVELNAKEFLCVTNLAKATLCSLHHAQFGC